MTGSIGFTGSYDIWDSVGSSYVTDFNSGDTILIASDTEVTGVVDGSFAADGIVAGDTVSHSDIVYSPAGAISDIWSVDGLTSTFTMDITTMNVLGVGSNYITLAGEGSISSTDSGLDTTPGTWIFSANTLGSNLTWSSSSTVVPTPPTVWLFGSGLVGLAGIARRNKSA